MSKGTNSPSASRLAGVMRDIAARTNTGGEPFDYGVIQRDGSLLTNTFSIPIPASDFLVCNRAVSGLSAGDRVLVAWVQNDAVVIDKIRSGSDI